MLQPMQCQVPQVRVIVSIHSIFHSLSKARTMRKLFSLLGLLLACIAGANGQDLSLPEQAVLDEIQKNPQAMDLTMPDVANAKTTDVGRGHDGRNKYVYMVQTFDGIEVANGRLSATVRGQTQDVKEVKTSFVKNIRKMRKEAQTIYFGGRRRASSCCLFEF